VLGRPFWGRYSHGIIDWLAINVVLYLALAAQVGNAGHWPCLPIVHGTVGG
jgi:hypothetical protein